MFRLQPYWICFSNQIFWEDCPHSYSLVIRSDLCVQTSPTCLHGLLWWRRRSSVVAAWISALPSLSIWRCHCVLQCQWKKNRYFEIRFEQPEHPDWDALESRFKRPPNMVWIRLAKIRFHVLFCCPDFQKSFWIQSEYAKEQIWACSLNKAL